MRNFLIYISLLFTFSLRADTLTWQEGNRFIKPENSVYYFTGDPVGKLSVSELANHHDSEFVLFNSSVLSFGPSEEYKWLRLTYNNPSNEALFLELSQALIEECIFYFRDSLNQWQELKAGYNTRIDQRFYFSHFQVFPLPMSSSTVYIKILNHQEAIPVKIWNSAEYERNSISQKIYYGIYIGIFLFVVLYNVFLFFSLHKIRYLHYAYNVALFLAISASVMDGYILYVFPSADINFLYLFLPAFSMFTNSGFAVHFLELKKYTPGLFRLSLVVVLYFAASLIILFVLPLKFALVLNTANALIVLFFSFFLGYKTWKKGNRAGGYYFLAYLIYFLIVIVQVAFLTTGYPPYLMQLSHVSWAILIESVLLAYLLSKRIAWDKEEIERARIDAQMALIEKTRENEKIVRDQNIVLEKKVVERTQELIKEKENAEEQRKRSDELLLNILPSETAEELKNTGSAVARDFTDVTVLFTDFKDFTKISEEMNARELVELIDYYYSHYDTIISNYGIEKIKTIGDSYMCAGGLTADDHFTVKKTILAALDIRDFMNQEMIRRQNQGKHFFNIRIGLNTGPVVAGVVGIKKFAYDIWGDTVNIASRMESAGEPGQVNISESTYDLVKDDSDLKFTSRGKIEAKNKGEIEMYFVDRVNTVS